MNSVGAVQAFFFPPAFKNKNKCVAAGGVEGVYWFLFLLGGGHFEYLDIETHFAGIYFISFATFDLAPSTFILVVNGILFNYDTVKWFDINTQRCRLLISKKFSALWNFGGKLEPHKTVAHA